MSDAGVRLLVSDVDGTLVDPHKRLTPATVAAVRLLARAGIAFTIISARPRSGMLPIAEALAIDAPMAAFNGGLLFRRDGSVIAHHHVAPEVTRGVLALAEGLAVDRWLFADDRWFASTDRGPHVDHERIASAQAPTATTDFAPFHDRADKITFVSDDSALLADLAARAVAAFGAAATIARSQPYYLDVTARRANKGDGVAALAELAGAPLSATAAIGDQANDLPMLARVGLSIAMGNAPAAVRAAADRTTGGNDADGAAQAIRELVLGRIGV